MPIELLTENHGDEIRGLLENTQKSIFIVSPFLGRRTCEELSASITNNHLTCKVITRFYREDFIQNVSSLEGLLSLLNSGAEIRCLIGLHTKLYMFDDNCSIITSANYTMGGLYSNIELGIIIDDEAEINLKCNDYFFDLWSRIEDYNKKNNNKATVTKEMIEEEMKIVATGSSSRTKNTTNSNPIKQGAKLDRIATKDLFETTLKTKINDKTKGVAGGWLKFDATAENRHDPDSNYFTAYNSFSRTKGFFPTRPTGIKAGDKIYLSLVSYDNYDAPTPIIMGRAVSKGFNRNNEVLSKFEGVEDWMLHYRFYIEMENIEIIEGPVRNGISLLDVYRKLKGDIYPSTFGRNFSFEEIREYHRQKDKIRLTKYATDYLDDELNKKFSIFGKVKI